jgi:hypothetical protein
MRRTNGLRFNLSEYAIIYIVFSMAVISFLIILDKGSSQRLVELKATSLNTQVNENDHQQSDRFGVKKIYDTKDGGREWYVNMEDPSKDPWFVSGDAEFEKQPDGSWRVGGIDIDEFNGKYHIIIGADTPPSQAEWRDVEITGYAKIISKSDSEDETEVGLQWYARGANHSDDAPCEGTSLKGRLLVDGTANWKKEIWHDGGYTDESETKQATDHSMIGRWIGWKVVMYNTEDNEAVKMESYIDDENDNNWKKVMELIDDGGWFASSSDEDFRRADCGFPKDYVVINSGPIASFRSDGIIWDFRNLSIREISP